jgi:predicted O-methyltransferase YrrM
MTEARWTAVDELVTDLLVPRHSADDEIDRTATALPPISLTPPQARFLQLLVHLSGARRVLEIGTLAGQSAIAMAHALPEGGRLVTLEIDPQAAEIARANVAAAGLTDRVEVMLGPASDTLARLDPDEPFDFVFLDADKEGYPDYLAGSLRLSRPGTVIVADNVVRDGAVADPDSTDTRVLGVRRFLEDVAAHPRLHATVIQTVGAKGYDGFCLAVLD